MTDKTVPIIVSTGEVVGTAKVSPLDENGKCYASINITEPKIVARHNGLVEVVLEKEEDE